MDESSKSTGKRSAPSEDTSSSSQKPRAAIDVTEDATGGKVEAEALSASAAAADDTSDEGSTSASESVPGRNQERQIIWLRPREKREPRVGSEYQADLPE
jgi:hypothetical protein